MNIEMKPGVSMIISKPAGSKVIYLFIRVKCVNDVTNNHIYVTASVAKPGNFAI